MATPLSSIPASAIIAELTSDPNFSQLSDSQRLQCINSALNDICNAYNLPLQTSWINQGVGFGWGFWLGVPYPGLVTPAVPPNPPSSPYVATNLAAPFTPQSNIVSTAGTGTASVAGTAITFSITFPDTNYILVIDNPGISWINPNTNVNTKTQTGFTAFAAQDNTPFGYIAQESS